MLLSSSFTRRFKNNFQGGVTYTRTLRKNDNTTGFGIQANNQFDLDGDWSQSSDFQRDTLRANGIVNLPWQFTLAGSFFYGSGSYYNATLSRQAVQQAGHEPPERRRADRHPGGRCSIAGKVRR